MLLIPQLEPIREQNTYLYETLAMMVNAINGMGKALKVDPKASPQAQKQGYSFSPPAPLQSISVSASKGIFTVILVDDPSNVDFPITYYLEADTDSGFGAPTVYPLGGSTSVSINLGNVTMYFRARSKFIQSNYSPYVTFGGASGSPVVGGAVTASDVTYSNGSTVQSLQPAQAGADVTAQNVASDTAKVNGVISSEISIISGLMPAQAGADVTADHTSAQTASLANQTLDGLADGSARLARSYSLIPYTGNATPWYRIGTLNAAGASTGTRLKLEFLGSYGGGVPAVDVNGDAKAVITCGEGGAPNLQGYFYSEGSTLPLVLAIKGVCTDAPTTGQGFVWDIYAQFNSFSDYSAAEAKTAGCRWAWSMVGASDPGSGVNIVAMTGGTRTFDANGHMTTHITSNVNQFDPNGVLRAMGLLDFHNLDNWNDGTNRFACLVKALANADGLPAGLVYAIMTAARQNAGLDGSGNLLFKSVETGTITTGVSIGSTPVALSSVISITTVGKPVKIGGIINCQGGATASEVGLQLYRDGSPLAGVAEMGSVWFPATTSDSKPIDYLDNAPSAGPHTYQLFGFNNGGPNATTQGGNFSAWEYA